jgi:hypothetical protein
MKAPPTLRGCVISLVELATARVPAVLSVRYAAARRVAEQIGDHVGVGGA